jgi:hypothetical protein
MFNAYRKEAKLREVAEEELRACKKKLAALEGVIYPRAIFELDFDQYGKAPSASRHGADLLTHQKFMKIISDATSGHRTGFRKDVEKFIRDFYGSYSGRLHNQVRVPQVFHLISDKYNDPAEVCGLCILLHYFKQPFHYYAPGSKIPSPCPFLPS